MVSFGGQLGYGNSTRSEVMVRRSTSASRPGATSGIPPCASIRITRGGSPSSWAERPAIVQERWAGRLHRRPGGPHRRRPLRQATYVAPLPYIVAASGPSVAAASRCELSAMRSVTVVYAGGQVNSIDLEPIDVSLVAALWVLHHFHLLRAWPLARTRPWPHDSGGAKPAGTLAQ